MPKETSKAPLELQTTDAFNKAIREPVLSVIHFSANWMDQCSQINDYLDTLSQQSEFNSAKYYQVPAEDLSEVAFKYGITAAPTTVFFRNGQEVDRVNGVNTAKIMENVKKHIETGNREVKQKEISLEERLKGLVNKSKVMLFMKGDREVPRCGFSRQIVQILNDTGVAYETFDILTDEEVRQGLKTYSDWPTYPQLYVNGELIGGLDIVKEMLAAGEFAATLKA